MNFRTSVKKSFGNVKNDMTELKVTMLELITNIVKTQAVMNSRLKRLEEKLNLNDTSFEKVKIELR